jgi:hypothetical protein
MFYCYSSKIINFNNLTYVSLNCIFFTVKTVYNDFDLGALIKDHRKKAGLTQLELADLAE